MTPYLGTRFLNGILHHRWLDGTSLPVLAGGAGDDGDDDDDDDDDDSGDDDDGDDESDDADDKPKGKKKAKDYDDESTLTNKQKANLHRSARQAARFRIEAKNERAAHAETTTERDDLKRELAFIRAAGQQFADADAAWKLVNKKLIEIDDDGEVIGVDEAIDALIESHPFIVTADDEKLSKKKDGNPFAAGNSGSQMRGKKRPVAGEPSATTLAKKYPVLRR